MYGQRVACVPLASQVIEIFSPSVCVVVGATVNEMTRGLLVIGDVGDATTAVTGFGVTVTG